MPFHPSRAQKNWVILFKKVEIRIMHINATHNFVHKNYSTIKSNKNWIKSNWCLWFLLPKKLKTTQNSGKGDIQIENDFIFMDFLNEKTQ